ncbi:hypothetical protein D3C71_1218060 [compost metagenome]
MKFSKLIYEGQIVGYRVTLGKTLKDVNKDITLSTIKELGLKEPEAYSTIELKEMNGNLISFKEHLAGVCVHDISENIDLVKYLLTNQFTILKESIFQDDFVSYEITKCILRIGNLDGHDVAVNVDRLIAAVSRLGKVLDGETSIELDLMMLSQFEDVVIKIAEKFNLRIEKRNEDNIWIATHKAGETTNNMYGVIYRYTSNEGCNLLLFKDKKKAATCLKNIRDFNQRKLEGEQRSRDLAEFKEITKIADEELGGSSITQDMLLHSIKSEDNIILLNPNKIITLFV